MNEEIERPLLLWIRENDWGNVTLTQTAISYKVSIIFEDLVKTQRDEGTSWEAPVEFKASHGWFDHFRKNDS